MFVGWSKPQPAGKHSFNRKLSIEDERLLWYPLIQKVAETDVKLSSLTKTPLPKSVKLEILRVGIDAWLLQVCPHSGRIWPSAKGKRK
jgi:hypothetical protein